MKAFKKTLTSLLLPIVLATSIGTADAATKRRAVSPGTPQRPVPQYVLPAATAPVRITNQGTAPANIKLCVETNCATATLDPGNSITYNMNGDLELSANQPVEARANNEAIPLSAATNKLQTIPIMNMNQALQIYATQAGSAEVDLLESNGVRSNSITTPLHQGTNTITTGFTYDIGKQLEIRPSVPVIMTSTIDGTVYRAKTLDEAVGEQFIVRSNNMIFIKNPDPTGTLQLGANTLPANTDNATAANFHYASALNYGTTAFTNLTGSVKLQGSSLNTGFQKFLAWSKDGVQIAGADKDNNLSLNQVPATVSLLNGSNEPATGTITGKDDSNNVTGTMDYQLPVLGNKDVDVSSLHATRIEVSANTGNVLLKDGYRMGKIVKVTGEDYVEKWLDPLQTQYFYLSNSEFRDMINGTPELASYAPKLAAVLGPATGNSTATMESILRNFTDGNASNGEVYTGFDPVDIDMRTPGGIRMYMAPNGVGVTDFKVDAQTMAQVYSIVRDYFKVRTQTYPSRYGGNTSTGPSITFNPTWSTQDSN